jgi:hypothetical protein
MKTASIALFTICLTGCATFSKTADEFRLQHPGTKTFCVGSGPAETFISLETHLKSCYEHVGKSVPVSALLKTPTYDQWIESKPNESGGSLSIVTKGGYVMVADVLDTKEAQCKTSFRVYLFNAMWNRHVSSLEKAAKLEEASCPM